MKLVGFDEFCRMPAGTVFAPYEPCVLREELAIKVDAGDSTLWKVGDTMPASFEIYDGATPDYMDYKMFLVFDESDIDRMINALVWAKNGCVGPSNCSAEDDE